LGRHPRADGPNSAAPAGAGRGGNGRPRRFHGTVEARVCDRGRGATASTPWTRCGGSALPPPFAGI